MLCLILLTQVDSFQLIELKLSTDRKSVIILLFDMFDIQLSKSRWILIKFASNTCM